MTGALARHESLGYQINHLARLLALRNGASGFLGKGVEPADLLDAIRVRVRC
jgi:hypothetical protein